MDLAAKYQILLVAWMLAEEQEVEKKSYMSVCNLEFTLRFSFHLLTDV